MMMKMYGSGPVGGTRIDMETEVSAENLSQGHDDHHKHQKT
jgi:hypothetical protein